MGRRIDDCLLDSKEELKIFLICYIGGTIAIVSILALVIGVAL